MFTSQHAQDDFSFQAEFVCANAWRLITMQDGDPLSPSFGCFHYAYWRDKTSEFPDARFQEAGATLGMLASGKFDSLAASESLPDRERLYGGFSAGLEQLRRQQYKEGCFDEWYKGERGFAVTEFTAIAYGLAARLLDEQIERADRDVLEHVLRASGTWLAARRDKVKANHQAAAAAALALIWKVTGDDIYRDAAKDALQDTLARQTDEGWFPEIGGMDLGYCSVLLDYCMLFNAVTGDDECLSPMRRLTAFMLPHIHPDTTISPESGLCLNPYVSRIGFALLAEHDETAASLVNLLKEFSPAEKALSAIVGDDLRFCRWSHLPLVALDIVEHAPERAAPRFAESYPEGWTLRQNSLVAAYHRDNLHVFVSAAGGGTVRAYRDQVCLFEDHGLALEQDVTTWVNNGYDTSRSMTLEENELRLEAPLRPATFFFPGFLSRLVLRVGCTFAWSATMLRAMIDWVRIRSGTAINQSAAPMAKGRAQFRCSRAIAITETEVAITDAVEAQTNARISSPPRLFWNGLVNPKATQEDPDSFPVSTFRTVKRFGHRLES